MMRIPHTPLRSATVDEEGRPSIWIVFGVYAVVSIPAPEMCWRSPRSTCFALTGRQAKGAKRSEVYRPSPDESATLLLDL